MSSQAEQGRQRDSLLEDKPTTGINHTAQGCRHTSPPDCTVPGVSQKQPSSPTHPFPLCQHQHFSPPPPPRRLFLLQRLAGVVWRDGRQKKKKKPNSPGKRIPPLSTLLQSLLEAKQFSQLFSLPLSFRCFVYTQLSLLSCPPPALPHPHADVRQQQASSPWLIAGSAAHSGSQLPHEK